MTTVRDAFFEVLRRFDSTTIFSNPGSTEVPLLTDLPADIRFVLCLHEASVVGAATGWALGAQRPAVVLLHTTAGYGNAVAAIATARVNRAPLVVVVGQQDRRHLAHEPFLTGELEGLAGKYPVWTATPTRSADVPALVARAFHEAAIARGPAVVIVPMNDWLDEYDDAVRLPAPRALRVAAGVDEELTADVAQRLIAARSPVLICGGGADDPRTWRGLAAVADALNCPVWQEPFAGRAGFPQDSKRFAGHLPAGRSGVRAALTGHDLVVVVGAASLRQYGFEDGELFGTEATVVVISDEASEVTRSVADLAILTPLPGFVERVAELTADGIGEAGRPEPVEPQLVPRTANAPGAALRATDVYVALGQRLPADAVVVEESPSTRSQLQDLLPARSALGFVSAAMGGLGFAMPAAMGLRMACPTRPVVAVVGDGSSLYAPQVLWSAQHYDVGVVYVVISNGGYAIMNWLAAREGGKPPWPSFDDIDVGRLAESLGCESVRVTTHGELDDVLDRVASSLAQRTTPIVINAIVVPDRPESQGPLT